jgi:3-oxoadipate enol-lactonase
MTLNLHCAVSGNGPDLVLLHPVGLDHTFWESLAAAASRDHRVLRVDLRGHGRSPAAERGTSVEDYADDVHAAIGQHCRGAATVLGLSFGGMLAQVLALRHPDAVAALVLCGCTGGVAPELRPVLRERGLAAERDGMSAIIEPTIERWFTPAFRDDPAVERVRERLRTDDALSWSAAWHAMSTFDAFPSLGEVGVPALVVAGEIDAATPLAAATKLAQSIRGARLTVLAGAPHMMHIECGDDYNAAVLAFLHRSQRGEDNG